jgi:glycosyltransferase involved in cell wall biosynthesis
VRVILVTGEYPPMRGGVGDYTSLLGQALARLDVEVTVVTSSQVETRPEEPVPVRPVVTSWGFPAWNAIGRVISEIAPDVVHLQYQTGAFDMRLGVNFFPWILRLRSSRPRIVVTFHDLKEPYILPKLGAARHAATHVLAAGADAVVVTNTDDLARVTRGRGGTRTALGWGKRPLYAIPIGSNIPSRPLTEQERTVRRRQLGVSDADLLLVYFGFLHPSKGLETLAEAFVRLVQDERPVHLLMLGAPARDHGTDDHPYVVRIRQRLAEPAVRERVTWTGFLPARCIAACLAAADVSVLPFTEGASLRHGTLIAAIVNHLPIVTTRPRVALPPLPSLVDGENALLVPPGDARALAGAIDLLIARPELRRHLAAGAARLTPHFDWEEIARATLKMYRELAASGSRP